MTGITSVANEGVTSMTPVWVLSAAIIVDLALGEPPNALHPVAWMGAGIACLRDHCPSRRKMTEFGWGLLVAVVVPSFFAAVAWFVLRLVAPWTIVWMLVSTLLLKSTFALRALRAAAYSVRYAIQREDLEKARQALRSLCSRNASGLDGPTLVAATVESVAENASDSFVAPIFYYALFGVPGAVFYRAVNTLDAMIGYHGRYEYLGKASARLDDLLNYIPARLTCVALLLGGLFTRGDVRAGIRILRRDGRRTESPNAGRPMATMAGLLRVRLEKQGHYVLGDADKPLRVSCINEAWRLVFTAGVLIWVIASIAFWVRHA